MRRRLGSVHLAEEAVAVAALDGLKAAVVIADTSGRVILMNRLAETLIAQGDGLNISQGRLTAREQKETDALHEMLLRAAAASRGLGKALPVALSVSRPSGKRPYALVAAPVPERVHMAGGAVLIHVIDPETQARPTAAVLHSLFHLTPAEADLACRLLAGLRIEEVAAERGVQLTTVRTQLQALFAKTSTNRQAELIRLLTRLTAVGSTIGEER
jgi:DNA-binding CsgD family transcriptional regulator